jgi:PhnB protein
VSIEPWLTVSNGGAAVKHYESALGATATYRLDGDDTTVLVARLEMEDAAFWIQEESDWVPSDDRAVRMIVTVDDPDASFERAIAAGATELAGVHEDHGWRSGRVLDRFGHDWEFGRRIDPEPTGG